MEGWVVWTETPQGVDRFCEDGAGYQGFCGSVVGEFEDGEGGLGVRIKNE
jgi:hypothetical protein